MGDERADSAPPQLGRWLVIAVVLIVGIVLYFRLAPRTRPVVDPVAAESGQ